MSHRRRRVTCPLALVTHGSHPLINTHARFFFVCPPAHSRQHDRGIPISAYSATVLSSVSRQSLRCLPTSLSRLQSAVSSLSLVLFAFKRGVVNRTSHSKRPGLPHTALATKPLTTITLTTLTHLTRSRTHTRTQHNACMARSEIIGRFTCTSRSPWGNSSWA